MTRAAMAERLERCHWCGKHNRLASDWEQQALRSDEYHRLCRRCARRRLDNPWNALLPMRKVKGGGDA